MIQMHEAITKKKTPMPILELSLIKNGNCYSTNLEFFLKSNSCNQYEDGLYRIINGELFKEDLSMDEFPEVDFSINNPLAIFEVNEDFFAVLKQAARFTSAEEMRPAMCGVHYDSNKQNITATDTHIMYVKHFPIETTFDFIIPIDSIEFLLKIIRAKKMKSFTAKAFLLNCDNHKNLIFHFDQFQFKTRLISQKYPDYKNVILPAKDTKRVFTFNRTALLNAVKALQPIAKLEFPRVFFKTDIERNTFVLEAFARDLNIRKEIPINHKNKFPTGKRNKKDLRLIMCCQITEADNTNFCVDINFLRVVLESISEETINFHFVSSKKAIVIDFQ